MFFASQYSRANFGGVTYDPKVAKKSTVYMSVEHPSEAGKTVYLTGGDRINYINATSLDAKKNLLLNLVKRLVPKSDTKNTSGKKGHRK